MVQESTVSHLIYIVSSRAALKEQQLFPICELCRRSTSEVGSVQSLIRIGQTQMTGEPQKTHFSSFSTWCLVLEQLDVLKEKAF